MRFPDDFVWGAATAAYQIEGSPLADGAGPSIWHRFTHTPGTIENADTGDVACDHYRRWPEDVALMRELNLGAYRFSISWPRILPAGRGEVNAAGLDHYDRFVDALCEAGITPFVTLYHWDLPAALQDLGGWANRDSAGWFADYADVVYERLGDRVRHWITLNEAWASANLGYAAGMHAPGMRDLAASLRAAHHLLLGHGNAVAACRARAAGSIGITNVTAAIVPGDPGDERDIAAAARSHAFLSGMYTEPVFTGRYPSILEEWLAESWPEIHDGDMDVIGAPIDFLGVNYYFEWAVAYEAGSGVLHSRRVEREGPKTEMGWEVRPEGLYSVLRWVHDSFGGPAMYVTENGVAYPDTVTPDGEVPDDDRLEFIRLHLEQGHRAIADGIDLRGWFVWSLMDNFEWAHGYSKRFGIVRVDYETQQRTVKRSGRWYAGVCASNAIERAPQPAR